MNKLKEYFSIESVSALLLFCGTFLALIISNTELNDEYNNLINLPISISVGELTLSKSLIKWVNDGLMALFFLLLTLETKYYLLSEDLIDKDHIWLAVIAALGGIVIPAMVYFSFTYHDALLSKGWAIPIATDTAFVLGILSFFKRKISINTRVFVVFLSIVDDVIAVMILATFYTPSFHFTPFLISLLLLSFLGLLNLLNVRYLFPYMLIGVFLWLSIIEAGVHGTIAGVLVGIFVPLHIKDDVRDFHSPLKRLEHALHPTVAFFILPVFAFLNVEISFNEISTDDLFSSVALGIICALFLGKQIGITLSSFLFLKIRKKKLPFGLTWLSFLSIASLCGIGFTFSLFIGLISFDDPTLVNQMKLGVLLGSILSALFGASLLVIKTYMRPRAGS